MSATPSAFFRHCAEERFEPSWLILSETCAKNSGITYSAHFDHPHRCPAWTADHLKIHGTPAAQ